MLDQCHMQQHPEKPGLGTTKSPKTAAAAVDFEQGTEAHSPWPGRINRDCVVSLSCATCHALAVKV